MSNLKRLVVNYGKFQVGVLHSFEPQILPKSEKYFPSIYNNFIYMYAK